MEIGKLICLKETPNFDDFDFEGDDEDEAILEETPEEV